MKISRDDLWDWINKDKRVNTPLMCAEHFGITIEEFYKIMKSK